MRIGFFTDSYLPRNDGISLCAETYRAGLEALGHEVYVFCPKRPEPFTEPTERIYRFRSLPSVFYEGYRDTLPIRNRHRKHIAALKLDIIHTFTPTQIGVLGMHVARKQHIPLVTTSNYDVSLINEYKFMWLAGFVSMTATTLATGQFLPKDKRRKLLQLLPVTKWPQKALCVATAFYNDACDLTTVPSVKTQQALLPYMSKKPVVLPLGTNLRFAPKHPNINSLRTKYGLPKEKVLFVSSSRLVVEKRIDFLLQAFARLSDHEKQHSALVIIGGGPLSNQLKKLAEKLNLSEQVIFVGPVKHEAVFEIVTACDIYAHTSIRETQGLVVNEAAACGKPLIMIDREVNPVLQAGKNGLFAEDNYLDYSKKMSRLLADKKLRTSYGQQSLILAKETSQEHVSKQLEALYKTLL